MSELNLLAILAAAFASFIFGALWYSPLLFIKPWCKAAGIDPNNQIDNPSKVYAITFILTLITAVVLAVFLGPNPDLNNAILSGGLAGIGLVATSMGINYQFANLSWTHWSIDAAFHIFRLMIMGAVLGMWH